MKRVVTASELRELDAAAEALGTPIARLMERAGRALARVALSEAAPEGRFEIFCGPGNNGGDGLVAAAELHQVGRRVSVSLWTPREKLKGAAAEALAKYQSLHGRIESESSLSLGAGDVVVDALLGTGLSRPVGAPFDEAIERIARLRARGARVVSADLPSGLESDRVVAPPCAVWADRTVGFGLPKLGQVMEPGASRCGATEWVDVGWPEGTEKAIRPSPGQPLIWLLEEADGPARLPVRGADTHKGSYGHLLIVAGSRGRSGAAALAARAALSSGVGKVTVVTRSDALEAVLAHCPEAMAVTLSGEGPLSLRDRAQLLELCAGADAIVAGPGIPRGPETGSLLLSLLESYDSKLPFVLDADALNALAELRGDRVLGGEKARLIMTPHPGEMARLCGLKGSEVQADRLRVARDFARKHRLTLVLKGARTLIAGEDGTVFVNPTGNPGMATAGSGDVLAGMLGALLAQGIAPRDAAIAGVYAHGLAGDLAAGDRGRLGLTASDLCSILGQVWVRWDR